MFKLSRKFVLSLGLVLIVLVVVSLNWFFKKPLSNSVVSPTNIVPAANEKEPNGTSQQQIRTPYTVKSAPKYTGRPVDEVRLEQGFQVQPQLVEKYRNDLASLKKTLASNPVSSLNDWLTVGIIKKFFNDYEGARDAWEYASSLYPDNGMAFANLGNLYAFYLNDKDKAELNYTKAIQNDPYQSSYYLGLADVYRSIDKDKISDIPKLMEGGLKYVNDVNLVLYLATYYRDEGDKANALKYYEQVLKMSPKQNGIQAEIDRLK